MRGKNNASHFDGIGFEDGDIVGQVWNGTGFSRIELTTHDKVSCPICSGKKGYRVREPLRKCWSWCCAEKECIIPPLTKAQRLKDTQDWYRNLTNNLQR